MKHWISIILIMAAAGGALARENGDAFLQGNREFQARRYENAIKAYESVLDAGQESADLYYNLGNACFKADQLAKAIWYYEKALKLSPGDGDIRFNLNVANARIVDKIDVLPELFYQRWWNAARSLFAANTWAWMSLAAVFLFLLFLALYLLVKPMVLRKISFFSSLLFLLLFLLTLVFAIQTRNRLAFRHEAIVFAPSVTIKSSPDPESVDIFVLHEGTKVSLLDALGEWNKISIANGSIGWIPAETLKEI